MKSKGSIPPPRTYHSSTTCWHRDKESGQLLVFSGGDAGTSPVRDRKVYKFDPGVYSCLHKLLHLCVIYKSLFYGVVHVLQ